MTDELSDQTGHLLRRAQQRHQELWLREVSTEVSSVQFAALTVLAGSPEASQRDLGDALELDRSTIADLVGRMVRRGLVERERSGDDRRRYVLRLTPAGRAELDRLRPLMHAIQPKLTHRLSPEDRGHLHRLLRLIIDTSP